MLDLVNFGPNPHAPEFGATGVYRVGHGKADNSSRPKRHSVLTSWDWVPGVVAGVDCHSLRRSYITHLIEDDRDPLSVQQQAAGRDHSSTISSDACVSSDYRTTTLSGALANLTATRTDSRWPR